MSDEQQQGPAQEPGDHGTEPHDDARGTEQPHGVQGRGGRRHRVREGVWAFFHPPAAGWDAPGEQRARASGERVRQRLESSAGLRIATALVALVVVALIIIAAWAAWRPSTPEPTGDETPQAVEPSVEPSGVESLPGGGDVPGDDEAGESSSAAETAPAEPVGESADDETLERINDGDDLVASRADEEQDPLVTGARFLRSLRTVDTATDEPADWYEARDSFLAESQAGAQTDWGEAGEQEADSNAVISWAEMDAAIEDGRGIAPDFEFGPQVAPGTHLVQVGMRLEREITAGDERIETPSGALMEAVVVCPPAQGVDRCVVTDWSEEPAGFVSRTDEAWEPQQ